MQVFEVIESAQGGQAMANLGRIAGIDEGEARAVAGAVLPELAWHLERNTLSRGGLADLVHALGQGHHAQILEAPAAWTHPQVVADGQAILRHILGSELKAQALSNKAARATGVGGGIIEMLLPILAQLLMGAIAKYSQGGLGDILSRLPIPGGGGGGGIGAPPWGQSGGGSRPAPRGREFETGGTMGDGRDGGGFGLPRVELPKEGGYPMPPIPGGTGEASPLPPFGQDPSQAPGRRGGFELPWPAGGRSGEVPEPPQRQGGGYSLPRVELPPEGGYPMPPMPPSPTGGDADIARGGQQGGSPLPFPLPMPGGGSAGNNPYGDLSDILRRQGAQVPTDLGGSILWRIVRSVLGSALGFGNRGVMGWIIQLIVMRWGWGFLKRILLGR